MWEASPVLLQLFPYSICKIKDECLSTHPTPLDQAVLLLFIHQPPQHWPQITRWSLWMLVWGGLQTSSSLATVQNLNIQKIELFKTNIFLNQVFTEKKQACIAIISLKRL